MDIITLIVGAGGLAAIMVLFLMWRHEREEAESLANRNATLAISVASQDEKIKKLQDQIKVLTKHRDYDADTHLTDGTF